MSSLQLEENNLKRTCNKESLSSDAHAAFVAKSDRKKSRSKFKTNMTDIKKKTKCYSCDQFGHWSKECPKKKESSNQANNRKDSAWFCMVSSNEDESNRWFTDSGASSHMTFHREWFIEYRACSEKRIIVSSVIEERKW